MKLRVAPLALPALVIATSCSSGRGLGTCDGGALLKSDPRIGVGGVVSDRVVHADRPVSCTLSITNLTDRPLYVASHFSSNNCRFA